jgi:hypothetical protein
VLALADKVIKLKRLDMTGVALVANWLARHIISLKKQVHPRWEHLKKTQLSKLLGEIFQSIDNGPTPNHVCTFYIQTDHIAVSRFI